MAQIAVVGGGIFGSSAAVAAARQGHAVDLFECREGLLQAASGINQYRLHRGYHYPRSSQTASAARAAEASFRREYGAAVIDEGRHIYAISRQGSLTSPEAFLAFCTGERLEFRILDDYDHLDRSAVAIIVEAREARIDPGVLRRLVETRLAASNVRLHLGVSPDAAMLAGFDKIIVAAYAGTNAVIQSLGGKPQPFQFEVCEKPVVTMPGAFGRDSVVVMDGPFSCIDPLARSGNFVLGNTVHAIHATNTGFDPLVPAVLQPLMNRGIIKDPLETRIEDFIESGAMFIPALKQARHVGSMYTVRTVLPNTDATDARPTLVSRAGDRLISIFSGKIGNCVEAANEALTLI